MEADPATTLNGEPVDNIVKDGIGKVRAALKMAMGLQGLQSYSDYPGVNKMMAIFKSSIISTMQSILCHQEINLKLADENILEDKFELLREYHDCIMERINSDLDDAQGIRRMGTMDLPHPIITTISAPRRHHSSTSGSSMVLTASRNVQKPQLFFSAKVDNSSKTPFMPIITDKPNSMKPLAIMLCMTEDGTEFYSHPYEYELNHWSPSDEHLSTPVAAPTMPGPAEDTPMVMVDTEQLLLQTVAELRRCRHVAVDVEHHGFRSYLGLTSLIQLSSRTKDYIIDPIKLRGQLTPLNEIFTNRKIVKVIHGADSDVLWLQRDCGLYLVNMFDTHIAAVLLDFPQRSLAALLQHFCNIQADKRYQRVDWRIRPLPEDFIEYARQDTHFLLYIHDRLHNMLLERVNGEMNVIRAVYDRSTALCLKRYEKPVTGPDSYLHLYARSRKHFNNRQEYALRELFLWRDKVARDHDESVDFVLPRHMLLQIAEVLPKEITGVLACCNPIPTLVKTELLAMHTIIKLARDQPLHKIVQSRIDVASTIVGGSGSTYCLHDLSHVEDSESLPCLLDEVLDNSQTGSNDTMFGDMFQENQIIAKFKKLSDLFGNLEVKVKKHISVPTNPFVTPFELYCRYKKSKTKRPQYDFEDVNSKNNKTSNTVAYKEDERVSRVRDHFLSLSSSLTPRTPATNNTPDDDEARVDRLLAQIRGGAGRPAGYSGHQHQVDSKKTVVMKSVTYANNSTANDDESSDDSSDDSSSTDSSDDSDSSDAEETPAAAPTASVKTPEDDTNVTDKSNTSESSSSDSSTSDSDESTSGSSGSKKRKSDGVEVNALNKSDGTDSDNASRKKMKLDASDTTTAGDANVNTVATTTTTTTTTTPVDTNKPMKSESSSSDDSSDDSDSDSDFPATVKPANTNGQSLNSADDSDDKADIKPLQKKKKFWKKLNQNKANGNTSNCSQLDGSKKAFKPKNGATKRKLSDGQIEPFKYEDVNYKMFTAKKRGRGGRGGKSRERGSKARGSGRGGGGGGGGSGGRGGFSQRGGRGSRGRGDSRGGRGSGAGGGRGRGGGAGGGGGDGGNSF